MLHESDLHVNWVLIYERWNKLEYQALAVFGRKVHCVGFKKYVTFANS